MIVTVDFLASTYGVHDRTAEFFINRKVPENNLYWHGKLLYLRSDPGFLIIPVFVDTLNRMKISRDFLLSEEFVQLLEHIGHIAALEEIKKITQEEAVEMCIQLTKDKAKNLDFFNSIVDYCKGGTKNFISPLTLPYSALHRADIFLFPLTMLDVKNEVMETIVKNCFAVIASFLMLDDAEDIEADMKKGDVNVFHQIGLNQEGFVKAKDLLREMLNTLKTFNRTMARGIDNLFVSVSEQPHLQKYFKS